MQSYIYIGGHWPGGCNHRLGDNSAVMGFSPLISGLNLGVIGNG